MSKRYRTKKKNLNLFHYLSAAIMALALAIAGYNLVPLRWPKTSGRILESRVEYESPSFETVAYIVHVRYTYDVDGRTYHGSRVWRTMSIHPLSAGTARAIAARYKPGREVEVRYNPDDPAEAVLEARIPHALWLYVGFGALLLLFTEIIQSAHRTPQGRLWRWSSKAGLAVLVGLLVPLSWILYFVFRVTGRGGRSRRDGAARGPWPPWSDRRRGS